MRGLRTSGRVWLAGLLVVGCAAAPTTPAEEVRSRNGAVPAGARAPTADPVRALASASPASASPASAGSPERSPPAAERAGEGTVVDGPPPPPPPLESVPPHLPELAGFYEKLELLERSRAKEDEDVPLVRLGWFGDSHTAADFLTDVVRRRLWERYRAGGPGFVRIGLADSRHGQVRQQLVGRFRHEPYLPAQRERFGDGRFSFAGVRTTPLLGARATLDLREPNHPPQTLRLHAHLAEGDALQLRVGSETTVLRGVGAGRSEIFERTLAPRASFGVELRAGRPRIFGATLESARGGLVLDTLGINGARAATLLAWDEESFRSGLLERSYDVVVLAFGTNEAFDATAVSKYPGEYSRVLARFRAATPTLECLILGPPDAQGPSGGSLGRVIEIGRVLAEVAEREGCAFLDQRELMGGEGSFSAWRNRPTPWARADRVHLTIAGYEELGRRLAERLLPPTGRP